MTDDQRKHLEILQSTVSRLAGNSFTIKGWSVTLVSALLAVAVKESDWHLAFLAVLPLVLFWALDAYYLRQERLFRQLYEAVRSTAVANDATGPASFSMNVAPYRESVGSIRGVAVSGPAMAFHGSLAVLVALGIVVGFSKVPRPAKQSEESPSAVSPQKSHR